MKGSYTRFFAMIATSTALMFALMYSTVYVVDHVWWSQTKFWMALYMGATMAIVMLAFMLGMYEDRRKNAAIFAGSARRVRALVLARPRRRRPWATWRG